MDVRPDPEQQLTELVDEIFRLNAALLVAGDAIVAPFELTSARWLVLGALAGEPLSVAEVARRRGLTRQSVRESALRLERDGLVQRIPDPHDARAPRLELTDLARQALAAIEPRRHAWAAATVQAVTARELQVTLTTLRSIQAALAAQVGGGQVAERTRP